MKSITISQKVHRHPSPMHGRKVFSNHGGSHTQVCTSSSSLKSVLLSSSSLKSVLLSSSSSSLKSVLLFLFPLDFFNAIPPPMPTIATTAKIMGRRSCCDSSRGNGRGNGIPSFGLDIPRTITGNSLLATLPVLSTMLHLTIVSPILKMEP